MSNPTDRPDDEPLVPDLVSAAGLSELPSRDDDDDLDDRDEDDVAGAPMGLGELFGAGGVAGLPDLGGLMSGMAQMQAAQSERYQGQAGGGAVRVSATGTGKFESVTIDPEVIAGGDVEMIQDLVLAALNDISARITEAQEKAMGALSGGLDLGALGGLGGLLGPDPE
jgi:DNA-binding YbaB/EbfC family protein